MIFGVSQKQHKLGTLKINCFSSMKSLAIIGHYILAVVFFIVSNMGLSSSENIQDHFEMMATTRRDHSPFPDSVGCL